MATLKESSVAGTGALKLPLRNIWNRPTGAPGAIHYNTTLGMPEFWTGSVWATMPDIVRRNLYSLYDMANPSCFPSYGETVTDVISGFNMSIFGTTRYNRDVPCMNFLNNTENYMVRESYPFPTTDVSVSVWFRPTFASSTACTPVTYSVGGGNDFLIYCASNTTIGFYTIGSGEHTLITVPSMEGRWVNITRTRTYSTGLETMYHNGIAFASKNVLPSNAITTNGRLIIGQESDTAIGGFDANQNLDGDWAFLAIYNRALTPIEVRQNFNATRRRFGV